MSSKNFHLLPILLIAIALQSCCRESNLTTIASAPVYMSYDELRKSVQSAPPTPLKDPGKIYFKDNYIFINEKFEGIHIIDNTNPSAPQNIGFIKIPGNVDLAIKGNYLYADNSVDLAVIDITNPLQVKEVSRIESMFPYGMPGAAPRKPMAIDRNKGIVVGWKDSLITQSTRCN